MQISTFVEPAIVLSLLIGGTLINRNNDDVETDVRQNTSNSTSPERLARRRRNLRFLGWHKSVLSWDTRAFRDRWTSKVLHRFPFMIEVLYWTLIYWVYQLGRAFTAVTIVESTIHVARRHALELIRLEKRLGIFWELSIQSFFLTRPVFMRWMNRTYSYVHIPASIFFLIWLYYITTAHNRFDRRAGEGSLAGPMLYEARRRNIAMCNLLAFLVFTLWPCMPPRLLSDKTVKSPSGTEARSYGFIDTVHGENHEISVWTHNRFCNQYAAMPSLHFGYSLMIGLTVATVPLPRRARWSGSLPLSNGRRLRLPSLSRLGCIVLGSSYTFLILVVIISTANHFILDAIAGTIVCALGWYFNEGLLNLLPLEDFIFWCLRTHKPERVCSIPGEGALIASTHSEDDILLVNNV